MGLWNANKGSHHTRGQKTTVDNHLPVSLKQTVTHVDAERSYQEAITNELRQKQPSEDPMEAWDHVKSTICGAAKECGMVKKVRKNEPREESWVDAEFREQRKNTFTALKTYHHEKTSANHRENWQVQQNNLKKLREEKITTFFAGG